eukprot:1538387-Rhodomonas_salina.2
MPAMSSTSSGTDSPEPCSPTPPAISVGGTQVHRGSAVKNVGTSHRRHTHKTRQNTLASHRPTSHPTDANKTRRQRASLWDCVGKLHHA